MKLALRSPNSEQVPLARRLRSAIEGFWQNLLPTEVELDTTLQALPTEWRDFWFAIAANPWTMWVLDGFSKLHHGRSYASPHYVAWVRQASPLGIAPFAFVSWSANHELAHLYTDGSDHCSTFPGWCVLSRFADLPSYFTARLFRKLCRSHRGILRQEG